MTPRSSIATVCCRARLDSLVFTFSGTDAVLARISAHHALGNLASHDGSTFRRSEIVVVHLVDDARDAVLTIRAQVVGVYDVKPSKCVVDLAYENLIRFFAKQDVQDTWHSISVETINPIKSGGR